MTGVNDMVSGMTIIAVGNSMPDLFVCTAIANQGYTLMASSGIFSSILLNFLLGFSLSTLLKTFRYPSEINLDSEKRPSL